MLSAQRGRQRSLETWPSRIRSSSTVPAGVARTPQSRMADRTSNESSRSIASEEGFSGADVSGNGRRTPHVLEAPDVSGNRTESRGSGRRGTRSRADPCGYAVQSGKDRRRGHRCRHRVRQDRRSAVLDRAPDENWPEEQDIPPKLWGPRVQVLNATGGLMVEQHRQFNIVERKKGGMKRIRMYTGVVDNPMLLRNCPFDMNDIRILFGTTSDWLTFDGERSGFELRKRPTTSDRYRMGPGASGWTCVGLERSRSGTFTACRRA